MRCKGSVVCILHFAFCITSLACGPRRVELPTDSGSPFPDFAKVHEQVSASCRGARTFQTQLSLRGRVSGQRLSGRVVAAFARPASMRLEGLAPIGQPLFYLVAQSGSGVLLFPRDTRVVRGQAAEAILEALIGVNLAPADLQAILTGCVVQDPKASAGRMHANGLISIDLQDGARLFLRRGAQWEVRAARRNGWQLEYTTSQSQYPASVRLISESTAIQVDLTATLSEVEANINLGDEAFRINIPPDTQPMTLDELRQSGPLRER